ncbi:Cyclic nucleotide-gated ion channel 1, partial [Cucurbita argyrosperma subsp. argyrosperma]
MQTYLQSTTTRLEEMRVRRRDAEQWMSHRLLPESLRERIRRYEQYKWQETRGVDEENLVRNLPKDLRRDIKRHLCLSLLMRQKISTSGQLGRIQAMVIASTISSSGTLVPIYRSRADEFVELDL